MKKSQTKIISIIGAGSWGTAIAKVIAEGDPECLVKMWAYEKEVVSSLNDHNENLAYLPGFKLPKNIIASSNFKSSLKESSLILLATPSKVIQDIILKIKKYLSPEIEIAYLTKGFCRVNNKILTISQTLEELLPDFKDRVVAISGPSHAEEVSRNFHTCLNIGSKSVVAREVFLDLFKLSFLQCRQTDDILGVELGGILKNPMAVAAGMISVLPECGDNLAGALIAESLKEMLRLAKHFGAREETIIDISGLGDLVTTALSDHSRNRRFGKDLAVQLMGKKIKFNFKDRLMLKVNPENVLEKLTKNRNYLAEGAYAIEPLIEIAKQEQIFVPVYQSLYEVLLNKKEPSLLIETIKNPDKFKGIYSQTKIQLADKNEGLEKTKGHTFKSVIIKEVTNHFKDNLLKKEEVIKNLKICCNQPLEFRDKIFRREKKLIAKINDNNFEKLVYKLSRLYVKNIIDKYNSFFNNLFLKSLSFFYFINFFLRKNRKIEIKGDFKELKKKIRSANVIYLPTYNNLFDFIFFSYAIRKKKLPFPRFLIYEDAIKSSRHKLFFKMSGAFIIDPSRFKNVIYKEAVNQYILMMIKNGIPILYPPEPNSTVSQKNLEVYNDFFKILVDSLYENRVEIVCLPIKISRSGDYSDSSSIRKQLLNRVRINFLESIHLSDYTRDSLSKDQVVQKIKKSSSN